MCHNVLIKLSLMINSTRERKTFSHLMPRCRSFSPGLIRGVLSLITRVLFPWGGGTCRARGTLRTNLQEKSHHFQVMQVVTVNPPIVI